MWHRSRKEIRALARWFSPDDELGTYGKNTDGVDSQLVHVGETHDDRLFLRSEY